MRHAIISFSRAVSSRLWRQRRSCNGSRPPVRLGHLLFFLLLFSPQLFAATYYFPSREALDYLKARPQEEGIWAIQVLDLKTGRPVLNYNSARLLHPASTLKLLTTAFALDVLGPQTVFRTQVYAEKPPNARGTVYGSLKLVGGGDPNLSSRIFPFDTKTERSDPLTAPMDELAEKLWDAGVRKVMGGLVADDRLFPQDPMPKGWTDKDKLYWYGAPVSALSFNDDMMVVSARPNRKAGLPADVTIKPEIDGFIRQEVTTVGRKGKRLSPRLTRENGQWVLKGQMRRRGGNFYAMLAQPDPAELALAAFHQALVKKGIEVEGPLTVLHRKNGDPMPPPANSVLIAERISPVLADAVTVVNKVSQNTHAEILLRQASIALGGDGSRKQALRHLTIWLRAHNILQGGENLDDASGLSRLNRLSPATLTALLNHAANDEDWGWAFYDSLPEAGEDGTLRRRMKGHAVRAKTGTVRAVRTLAGYFQGVDRRPYAFAILVNGFKVSSSTIKKRMDHLIETMAYPGPQNK